MTRQRIRTSIWTERVAHWHGSGLSADAYSRQNDFAVERLKYWARRVERDARGGQLLPVRVSAVATLAPIELRGPSGWSVRMDGVDAA